jgi:hypothetical protein
MLIHNGWIGLFWVICAHLGQLNHPVKRSRGCLKAAASNSRRMLVGLTTFCNPTLFLLMITFEIELPLNDV